MATERHTIEIEVTDKGTLRVFEQGGKTLGEFARQVDGAGRSAGSAQGFFDSLGGKILTVNHAFDLAGRVVRGAQTAFDAFFSVVERGGAIDDLAQKVGVSREALASLELAAQTSGVSLEGLGSGIKLMSRNLAEAAGGNKELAASFRNAGVDIQAGLANPQKALVQLADTMERMPDSGAKTALSMQLVGKAGSELLPFFNQGGAGLERMIDLSQRLGTAMSDSTVRAADQFGDNLEILGTGLQGIATQVVSGMLPALAAASEQLVAMAAEAGIADGQLQAFGVQLGGAVVQAIGVAINAVAGLIEGVALLGQAFTLGLATIEVAATGIATAVVGAYQSIAQLDPTGLLPDAAPLLDNLKVKTEEAAQGMEAAWAAMGTGGGDFTLRLAEMGNATIELGRNFVEIQGPAESAAEGHKRLGGAIGEAGKAAADFAAELAKAGAAASAQQGYYAQAASGALTFAQAEQFAAAASEAATKGLTSEDAVLASLIVKRQQAAAETQKAAAATIDGNLASAEAVAILREGIAAGTPYEEVQRKLAVAAIDREAANRLAISGDEAAVDTWREAQVAALNYGEQVEDLNATLETQRDTDAIEVQIGIWEQVEAGVLSVAEAHKRVAIEALKAKGVSEDAARAQVEATDRLKKAQESVQDGYVDLGDTIKDSLSQVFDALIAGTLDLGDSLKSLGLAIGKRFFEAMLDSKLKSFDPAVKANFLDLGAFGQEIFGNLFGSGGGSGGAAGAGVDTGGLFQGAVDWVTGIFNNGNTIPADQFVGPRLENGAQGTTGAGNYFSGQGALAGGAGGYAGAQLFGPMFMGPGSTGLTGALRHIERQLLDRMQVINEIVSAVAGAIVGGFAGGGGVGGGIIGLLIGLASSLFGGIVAGGIDRSALRNRRLTGFAEYAPTVLNFTSGTPSFGLERDVLFSILGIPTLGTAFRRAGEGVLDASSIFGGEDGRGGLQGELGDFSRSSWSTGIEQALARGMSEVDVSKITGGGESIFAQIFKDELPEDAARAGDEMGKALAEFLSRGLAEGMDTDDMLAALRGLAQEAGITLQSSIENLPRLAEGAAKAAQEFGGKDPLAAARAGAEAYAEALFGITAVFANDVPRGVNIGAVALSTLEKDGVKAFGEISRSTDDWLRLLAKSPEEFRNQVADLAEQGFTIDAEEFENRIKDISASAEFLGANLQGVFAFEDIGEGIDALMDRLRAFISDSVFTEGIGKLFDTTNIASSFEPVFMVLRNIENFDLTTATGAQEFRAYMIQAVLEGRANLEEYIPQLKAIAEATKLIDEAMKKALEPGPLEALKRAFDKLKEDIEQGIKGALQSAVNAGFVDGQFDVGAFGRSFEQSIRDAVFNGIVNGIIAATLAAGPLAEIMANVSAAYAAALDPNGPGGAAITDAERAHIEFWANQLGPALADAIRKLGPEFEYLADKLYPDGRGGSGSDGDRDRDPGSFQKGDKPTPEEMREFADYYKLSERDRWLLLKEIADGKSLNDIWNELEGLGAFGPSIENQAKILEAYARDAQLTEEQRWQLLAEFAKSGMTADEFWAKVGELGPLDPEWRERNKSSADRLADSNDNAATSAEQLASTIDAVSEAFNRLIGVLGSFALPGAASGGTFSAGGMAVVGEAGPELMVAHAGGGASIIPLTGPAAARLLGHGMPGLATGGYVGASANATNSSAPRDPSSQGSGDDAERTIADTVAEGVISGFASAIQDFAAGGSAEEMQEALRQNAYEGILAGMIEALLAGEAIQSAQEELRKAFAAAMADGVIDASEAEALGNLGRTIADQVAAGAEAAGPAFDALAEALGIGLASNVADGVISGVDGAIADYAQTMDLEALREALNRSAYEGILAGMIEALLAGEAIEAAQEELRKAFAAAMEDGVVDAAEAEALGALGDELADSIAAAAEAASPAFQALAEAFGIDAATAVTREFRSGFASALTRVIDEGGGVAAFGQAIRETLYAHARDALINAFIDQAVIGGALAPMLAALATIFAAALTTPIDETVGLIAEQMRLIGEFLNSPEFTAAMDAFLKGMGDLRDSFGITIPPIVAQTDNVIGRGEDLLDRTCEGKCALQKEILDYGFAAVDNYGRLGQTLVERYIPKFDDGGIAVGPDRGYLAMLHGREIVLSDPRPVQTGSGSSDSSNRQLARELRALRADLRDYAATPLVATWNEREVLRAERARRRIEKKARAAV